MSGSGGDGGRGPKNAPSGARNLPAGVTITCRSILPLQGPPLERGWLRIGRGRIEGIGRRRPSGLVIDLGDAIILPGLVNAHTHLEFSDLTAPLPAGSNLTDWIEEWVRLRRARVPGAADETRLAGVGSGRSHSLGGDCHRGSCSGISPARAAGAPLPGRLGLEADGDIPRPGSARSESSPPRPGRSLPTRPLFRLGRAGGVAGAYGCGWAPPGGDASGREPRGG